MNRPVTKWKVTNVPGKYEKCTNGTISNGGQSIYEQIVSISNVKSTVTTSSDMTISSESLAEVGLTSITRKEVNEIGINDTDTTENTKQDVNISINGGVNLADEGDKAEVDLKSDIKITVNGTGTPAIDGDTRKDSINEYSDSDYTSDEDDTTDSSEKKKKSHLKGLNICQYKLR